MFKNLLWGALLSCILFSCDPSVQGERETDFTRTVIVYLGRDNNLSGSEENKIESMLKGWDGKNGNLIIYQDSAGNAKLMRASKKNGIGTIETLEEYGDENSANSQTLKRVINDAISLYPADSYGLIMFSHATGWLPEGAYPSLRSFFKDGSSEMELTEMGEALREVNVRFDYLVLELCFSTGIEVAYELKDNVSYILGSSAEILSPGFRDIYARSMNKLFEKDVPLVSFAQESFNQIDAHAEQGYRSGTLSVIKTSELSNLAAFIKANQNRQAETDIAGIQSFDRKTAHTFFDFKDYFSRTMPDEDSRQRLSDLIDNCVLYKASTPTFYEPYEGWFFIRNHSGLTTYIPQNRFPELNEAYKSLKWYKAIN
ncbi:clostripain [Bacteroidia bacterium]|nr:clostripain [Bacteroidia bacterium]